MQTVSNATQPYSIKDWQRGYESQRQEAAYWIENIEGTVPTDLNGTLFRNGPGLLDINGQPIQHPFDGDGMVCAFTFDRGRVHFRNRHVRTEGFLKEQQMGQICYRGVFGTAKPGGWLANAFDFQIKNIANTNIIYWGDKLLALWEAGQPYRLDPTTLKTYGIDRLDGILGDKDTFAAHPRIDPHCEMDGGDPCLVNFALDVGLSTQIRIYEISPQGKLKRKQVQTIPGFAFIHDFAITPHYCIFFQNPISFNPLPFALGMRGAGECIRSNPKDSTRVVVIPRDPNSGESVRVLEADAGFIFHHGNAFERDQDTIIMDSIAYPTLQQVDPNQDFREVNFEALDSGQLWRFTLNLQSQQVNQELLSARCVEFPTLHPDRVGRNHRYLYLGAAHNQQGNAPLQSIFKIDLETRKQQLYSFAPKGFVGEPIFVPKPGSIEEDEGWLLVMVYDAAQHRSDLVILDAQKIEQGAIARLHLRYHIPYGLHGSWTPVCFPL